MISNEWEEYLAYVGTPEYFVNDKKSYPFLGRFTLNMIPKNNGFNRILTILARRYLFHNAVILIFSDCFFSMIRQWKKDRAEYRTIRNGRNRTQIYKTILRRCTSWGKRFQPPTDSP